MEPTDKLVIADEMLDAAIVEFLDHKRYFASLNLAGVAEEIYGNFLKFISQSNIKLDDLNNDRAISKIEGGPELTDKEWWENITYEKNKIKHLDSIEDQYITIVAEQSSRLMIDNALSNHIKLHRKMTPTIHRFFEFDSQRVIRN
jgi:hypothetical protein